MESYITFSAITMDGPRITPMPPPISSDLMTGMLPGGIPGTNTILITGRIFLKGIPIGADTNIVSVMARIFIISTIVARVKVGIKDSMARVHPEPPALVFMPLEPLGLVKSVLPQPLDLAILPEQPALVSIPLEPLVLEKFVLPEPLGLAQVNPEQLDLVSVLPEPLDLAILPEPPVLVKSILPELPDLVFVLPELLDLA
jgi:hypothetical protein